MAVSFLLPGEDRMNKGLSIDRKKVWVAGHKGMLGSALIRELKEYDCDILTVEKNQLDLINQAEVERWIKDNLPEVIFIAAARVGGIEANNKFPAEFLYQNLMIQTNIIHSAFLNSIPRVVYFGSSCSYPKFADQPIAEESLLTGIPEMTNLYYSIAKIAGMKMTEAYSKQYGTKFISIAPANAYGPGDNFNPDSSHVIPAMLRKFDEALKAKRKSVTFWGSGEPLREFLYIDDLAKASIFLAQNYFESEHINVGSGIETSVKDLATIIAEIVGYDGEVNFDTSKPDGMPRKLLDSSKITKMAWKPKVSLLDGISKTYDWYKNNKSSLRN